MCYGGVFLRKNVFLGLRGPGFSVLGGITPRLGVDIDSEFLLASGLHGLLMHETEVLQTGILRFLWPEVPG